MAERMKILRKGFIVLLLCVPAGGFFISGCASAKTSSAASIQDVYICSIDEACVSIIENFIQSKGGKSNSEFSSFYKGESMEINKPYSNYVDLSSLSYMIDFPKEKVNVCGKIIIPKYADSLSNSSFQINKADIFNNIDSVIHLIPQDVSKNPSVRSFIISNMIPSLAVLIKSGKPYVKRDSVYLKLDIADTIPHFVPNRIKSFQEITFTVDARPNTNGNRVYAEIFAAEFRNGLLNNGLSVQDDPAVSLYTVSVKVSDPRDQKIQMTSLGISSSMVSYRCDAVITLKSGDFQAVVNVSEPSISIAAEGAKFNAAKACGKSGADRIMKDIISKEYSFR